MPSAGVMASAVHIPSAGCTDVLNEPFDNLTAWTLAPASSASIVSGRTGSAVSIPGSSNWIQYTVPAGQESNTITLGFAWRCNTISTTETIDLFSTGSNQCYLIMLSGGALEFRRSDGTVLATSASGILVTNTWYYIELQAKLHDTTGFVKVRVNGIQIINTTGIDTLQWAGKITFDTVRLTCQFGQTAIFDDLYISAGATCFFKGDHTIGTCNSVLNEPFNDFTTNAWALAGTTAITGGRTGTGAKITNFSGSATYTIPSAKENDTITIGCAVKVTGMGSEAIFMTLRSDSAATTHTELRWNSAGAIVVVRGASGIGTSATGVISLNTWAYVEVQVKMHDSIGYLKVRVNEKTVIDNANIDTRNAGTKTKFDSVRLECTWYNVFYDDVYITTGDCVFRGVQQIVSNCTEVWTDSFDDVSHFPSGGLTASGGGRGGGTALNISGSGGQGSTTFSPQASNYATVGFAYKTNLVGSVIRGIYSFRDAGGGDLATLHIAVSGALELRISNGGGLVGTSAAGAMVANVWNYIETNIFFSSSGSVGYATVKLNGATVISVDGVNTAAAGQGPFAAMFVRGAGSGGSVQFDDMYIKTGAGCGFGEDPSICNLILQEPFDNFTTAPWVMGTIDVTESPSIIGGGRNGSGCQCAGRSYIYYRVPMDYFSNVLTLGFAWKVSAVANDIITGWEAKGDTAHYNQVGLFTNSSGGFEFRKYPTMTVLASGGTYTANTWYYIEIQMKLGANGFVRLRVNGTTVISTNTNTFNSTDPTTGDKFVAFGIGSTEARVMTIDDLYLTSGGGCAWQNDHVAIGTILMEPFNNFTTNGWNTVSSPTIVSGRTGTAAQLDSIDRVEWSIPVAKQSDYLTAGVAFRTNDMSALQHVMKFYRTGSIENMVAVNTNGSMAFCVGNTPIWTTTATGLIVANIWYYVEVQYYNADVNGWFKIRLNNNEILSGSGDTRSNGTPDVFRLDNNAIAVHLYDDVYLSAGGNSFKGDITIP